MLKKVSKKVSKTIMTFVNSTENDSKICEYAKSLNDEDLANFIFERTNKWGDIYRFIPKKQKPLSEKALKIKNLFNNGVEFGCKTNAAKDLLSIVIDENISEPTASGRRVFFSILTCIVLKNNPNSHNYPVGEPIVLCASKEGGNFRINRGDFGNSLPTDSSTMRLATLDEIKTYISKVDRSKYLRA